MIIVYERHADRVMQLTKRRGIQAVRGPTDCDQASPHEDEPVSAHTRATIRKQKPAREAMAVRRKSAGMIAEREAEKKAMPLGSTSTPDPTSDFTSDGTMDVTDALSDAADASLADASSVFVGSWGSGDATCGRWVGSRPVAQRATTWISIFCEVDFDEHSTRTCPL